MGLSLSLGLTLGSAALNTGVWWQSGAVAAGEFAPAQRYQQNGVRADASAAYAIVAPARYVQKSNGDWLAATANDPAPTDQGVQIEGAETNIVPDPYNPMAWTDVGSVSTALGQTIQAVFTGGAVIAAAASGASAGNRRRSANIAFTSGQVYIFKARYKAGTSGRFRLTIEDNTSGNSSSITGALAVPVAATSAAGTIVVLEKTLGFDGVYNTTFSFTPNFLGNGRIGAGPDTTTNSATVIFLGLQGGINAKAGSPIFGLETRAAVQMTLKRTGTNDWRLTADNGEEQFFLDQTGGDLVIVPANLNRTYLKAWAAFKAGAWSLFGTSTLASDYGFDATADVIGISGNGQSLSIGARGQPLISTTQPYSSETWSFAGPRTLPANQNAVGPLVEVIDVPLDLGETGCAAMCNYANDLLVKNGQTAKRFFSFAPGEGAKALAEISKGTIYYTRLIAHVQNAFNYYAGIGLKFVMGPINMDIGQKDSDPGPITQAEWLGLINQFLIDVNQDIFAITGQPKKSPVFINQTNRPRATPYGPLVCFAQLQAANENPGIVFNGAMSQFGSTLYDDGGTHKNGLGYNHMFHSGGLSIFRWVNGLKTVPFQPVSAVASGQTVYISFSGGFAPRFNLTDIAGGLVATDYGLVVRDTVGKLTLSNFRIVDRKVAIDINRTLVGTWSFETALEITTSGYLVSSGCMTNLTSSMPRFARAGSYALPEVAPHSLIYGT